MQAGVIIEQVCLENTFLSCSAAVTSPQTPDFKKPVCREYRGLRGEESVNYLNVELLHSSSKNVPN